jgi:glycosyltransferase involved in cell wall biosynthesis
MPMTLDIALPFHGDVGLFKEAVYSVLAQDSAEWRLIIVNDAHPDFEVDEWVKNLEDKRIKYVRNEKNLGPSFNYAKCLDLIEEKHCVIFGADDILEPNFVSQVSKAIVKNPNSAIYHPLVKVIDECGKEYLPQVDRIKGYLRPRTKQLKRFSARQVMPSLMTGNWMYFPAIVWDTETVRKFGFRKDLNVCQDIWLISEILISGGELTVIPEEIFRYRRFAGSDSSVKLLNGVRFKEEKKAFYGIAVKLGKKRMYLSAFTAVLHLTSRLHALTLFPQAIRKGLSPKHCLIHLIT